MFYTCTYRNTVHVCTCTYVYMTCTCVPVQQKEYSTLFDACSPVLLGLGRWLPNMNKRTYTNLPCPRHVSSSKRNARSLTSLPNSPSPLFVSTLTRAARPVSLLSKSSPCSRLQSAVYSPHPLLVNTKVNQPRLKLGSLTVRFTTLLSPSSLCFVHSCIPSLCLLPIA